MNYHLKLQICLSVTGQILPNLWDKLLIGALVACFLILEFVSSINKAVKTSIGTYFSEIS